MSHVGQAPSGFVVQPDISDTGCNAGRGARVPARFGEIPVVASGTMADGSTLIASSGYPTVRSVVLHSVTAFCAPNRDFGNEGVATVALWHVGRTGVSERSDTPTDLADDLFERVERLARKGSGYGVHDFCAPNDLPHRDG